MFRQKISFLIKNKAFIGLVCALILSSCATNKIYFTEVIRRQVEAENLDLTHLQYYIDNDIELEREVNSDTAKIKSGKLIYSNGKFLNRIVLKANTRGVCTYVYPNRLAIAFEQEDNKFLTFGPPNLGNAYAPYQLYTSEMLNQNYNKISYEGEQYTLKLKDVPPKLKIVRADSRNDNTQSRRMRGVSINNKK